MRILIAGANGQLGREFVGHLKDSNHSIYAPPEETFDIANIDIVHSIVSETKPDLILNCAAYNLVDKAEEELEVASRVNALGVKNLAIASRESHATLVHYGTDYVFDGTKEDWYDEDDIPNPVNVYGKTKLAGEQFLQAEFDDFLLLRLSWVFGRGKQNFLYKLTEWAEKNKVLKVVYDQISVPTYTEDIVTTTMNAIEKGLRGLYHLTNSGYASRYEVAKYFLDKRGYRNLVLPVDSRQFKTLAQRPFFTAMSNKKLSKELGLSIPSWMDAVDRFVSRSQE